MEFSIDEFGCMFFGAIWWILLSFSMLSVHQLLSWCYPTENKGLVALAFTMVKWIDFASKSFNFIANPLRWTLTRKFLFVLLTNSKPSWHLDTYWGNIEPERQKWMQLSELISFVSPSTFIQPPVCRNINCPTKEEWFEDSYETVMGPNTFFE